MNPCSKLSVLRGQMYHPYPGRKDLYIQCTRYGAAYTRRCGEGQIWNHDQNICTAPRSITLDNNLFYGTEENIYNSRSFPSRQQIYKAPVVSSNTLKSFLHEPYTPQKKQTYPTQHANRVHTTYFPQRPVVSRNHVYPKVDHQYINHQSTMIKKEAKKTLHTNDNKAVHKTHEKTIHREVVTPRPNSKIFYPKIQFHVSEGAKNIPNLPSDPYSIEDSAVKSVSYTSTYTREEPVLKTIPEEHDYSESLNPCTHENIRFVSHPGSLDRYIECQNGVAIHRRCAEGNAWIQPLRKCMNTLERLGNAILPTEACVRALTRYNPNPEDSTSYIECLSWYHIKKHQCPIGQLWVQSVQKCMSETMNYPVRTVIRHTSRPHNTDTSTSQAYSNICSTDEGFYHPYPNDNRQFIQCDQFGNMYVRECSEDMVWSNDAITCVSDSLATTSTDTIKQETHVASTDDYYEALSVSDKYVPNCSEGDTWDATYELCVKAYTSTNLPLIPINGPVNVLKEIYSEQNNLLPEDVNNINVETIEYNGENPCEGQEDEDVKTYYFMFPLDPAFFIQCDQTGNMFIQPCASDMLWSPTATTCIPTQQPDSFDPYAPDAKSIPTLSVTNPCLDEDADDYHSHPHEKDMFIKCDGDVPYTFHCMEGLEWDEYAKTCEWPSTEEQG